MDTVARFVAEENVSRFVDRLHIESDPGHRSMLRRLLMEEESRFSALSERLEIVERHIENGTDRLEKQKSLLAGMIREGRETHAAETAVERSEELLELLQFYRQQLTNALDRNDLVCADKIHALRESRS